MTLVEVPVTLTNSECCCYCVLTYYTELCCSESDWCRWTNLLEQPERLWTSDTTARVWTHSNRSRDENDLSFIYCQVSVVAVAALFRPLNNRCVHVQRGVLGSRVLDPHQRQTLESQYQTPQRLTFPGFPFSKTSIFSFRTHPRARARAHAHTNTRPLRLRDQSSLGHYDSKAQSQSQLHVGGATLTPLTKCHLRSCVRKPWAG